MTNSPMDRSYILTEQRNERTMHLHTLSVAECVRLIREEDRAILTALEEAHSALTAFLEDAERRFCGPSGGGRLLYLGAGTSGRLGVLDAAEAPPTFQVEPGRIVGIIAGGEGALRRSSEGKEDQPDGSHAELDALGLTEFDTVIGIAAGGTTPYVLGALEYAKRLPTGGPDPKGANRRRPLTALLVCAPIDRPTFVDHLIVVPTGPEVLTGSTRMKAGTATKMVLNTISTTLMVRSGRVYENLMVDLRVTNGKLHDRAARIICQLTGCEREEAIERVHAARGSVKIAVAMHRLGCDWAAADAALERAGGRLDRVLAQNVDNTLT